MIRLLVSLPILLLALTACASPLASNPPIPTPATVTQPIPTVTTAHTPPPLPSATHTAFPFPTLTHTPTPTFHPLMIEGMRLLSYPGSDLVTELELDPGGNYSRAIVSYQSDGLKIYALLTVPFGEPPAGGWPVIVFNHGYIPPDQYRTTERYIAYVDWLARSGYMILRPDYRGHGDSEGAATGGYSRPDYTIDVLNAVASIRRFPGADPQRIGMWGHSMGGHITLRAMVTTGDIKAGVIWAGVVASYPDLMSRWRATPPATISSSARGWRQQFSAQYGTPEENPAFWSAISPDSYLSDLSGPLQLHHAEGDESVPVLFSHLLYEKAQAVGAPVELFIYPGDNHNINTNFAAAMTETIKFFDLYLKN